MLSVVGEQLFDDVEEPIDAVMLAPILVGGGAEKLDEGQLCSHSKQTLLSLNSRGLVSLALLS